MKRIGVTEDAISIFHVAFLDELRCWEIKKGLMGLNGKESAMAIYRPPVKVKPDLAESIAENIDPVTHRFEDRPMAVLFVQQQAIKAGLITLMGQEDLQALLPIVDVPDEAA